MVLKTIKNVEEEVWRKFKLLSVKNGVPMGRLLDKMIRSYESSSKEFWSDVLSGEKIISDSEAELLLKTSKEIRKEYGFRK